MLPAFNKKSLGGPYRGRNMKCAPRLTGESCYKKSKNKVC